MPNIQQKIPGATFVFICLTTGQEPHPQPPPHKRGEGYNILYMFISQREAVVRSLIYSLFP